MSYGMSAALQEAVFQRLETDPALTALVGTRIYDAAPPGQVPGLYVTLGPERVRDRSDATGGGALHDFSVSVVTDETGFADAKAASGAVSDALIDAPLALARGRLVSLNFLRAEARRVDRGARRRIDLTFRARVEDD